MAKKYDVDYSNWGHAMKLQIEAESYQQARQQAEERFRRDLIAVRESRERSNGR